MEPHCLIQFQCWSSVCFNWWKRVPFPLMWTLNTTDWKTQMVFYIYVCVCVGGSSLFFPLFWGQQGWTLFPLLCCNYFILILFYFLFDSEAEVLRVRRDEMPYLLLKCEIMVLRVMKKWKCFEWKVWIIIKKDGETLVLFMRIDDMLQSIYFWDIVINHF